MIFVDQRIFLCVQVFLVDVLYKKSRWRDLCICEYTCRYSSKYVLYVIFIAKICRGYAFCNTFVESKEETHLDLKWETFSKQSNILNKQGVKVQHGLVMQYHGYSFRERSSLWILGINSTHMHWFFQKACHGCFQK